jgi:hypothetical protein
MNGLKRFIFVSIISVITRASYACDPALVKELRAAIKLSASNGTLYVNQHQFTIKETDRTFTRISVAPYPGDGKWVHCTKENGFYGWFDEPQCEFNHIWMPTDERGHGYDDCRLPPSFYPLLKHLYRKGAKK